ncbi:MAG: hypothetical protein ONB05_10640, partial [candidate division KSB1 bacterium]|nr:hypothetical protein [candidate division KSB1 bacterium]
MNQFLTGNKIVMVSRKQVQQFINILYQEIVQKAQSKTKDFLMRLERRLRDYAYLCFLDGYETRAELALVAANTLHAIPPPLLDRMEIIKF